MEDQKKKAYKILIYQAFLDIKNNNGNKDEVFHIAHTFHNLAELLPRDFDELNEEDFWNRVKFLEDNFSLCQYRKLFKSTLNNDN